MVTDQHTDFIALKTNDDGYFKVTISTKNGIVVFSETMLSSNSQIVLKGFSLKTHSITLSPIN